MPTQTRRSGWHHARLVMNRHHFGAPHGLPLSNLRRCFADPENRTTPSFIQDWSAKIVEGELLLRGVHIWFARERPPGPDGRKRGGRPFHRDVYYLCPHIVAAHTDTGPHAGVDPVLELLLYRGPYFWKCRNVLTSCDKCLTDYTVTVKRVNPPKKKTGSEASTLDQLRSASVRQIRRVLGLGKKNDSGDSDSPGSGIQSLPPLPPSTSSLTSTSTSSSASSSTTNQTDEANQESGWVVTIKTYHQFGPCRSPTDLRWLGLTMDPSNTTRILYRDSVLFPRGCVKRNWDRRSFAGYWNEVAKIVKPKNGVPEV